MKRYVALIVVIGIILGVSLPIYAQDENANIKAKVIKDEGIEEVKQEDGKTQKVQKATVKILEGEYEEEEYQMNYILSDDIENPASNPELKEKESILVTIEEKDGEITKIDYQDTVTPNYILYGVLVILIIALLVIGKGRVVKPIMMYLITIILASVLFILSIQNNWNLIWIAGIIAIVITAYSFILANGINKKTGIMVLCAILGIAISGIIMYLLFDTIGLTDTNVKIAKHFTNMKELICAMTILSSCGICSVIILFTQNLFEVINRPYKTKSDNIIEGQRSLKL